MSAEEEMLLLPLWARVPLSSGLAAHPHGSLLPWTRTEVPAHRGWQFRQLPCPRFLPQKPCPEVILWVSVFTARMSCNKQKTVWALLSGWTASPVQVGPWEGSRSVLTTGWAHARAALRRLCRRRGGISKRSQPAWGGCSQLRCWGCQIGGGGGGLVHLAHRRLCLTVSPVSPQCPPHCAPLPVSPMSPSLCVPSLCSHVPVSLSLCPPHCASLPVSVSPQCVPPVSPNVPLSPSVSPSLCPMSPVSPHCVPMRPPGQCTVRPSLWTTAPRHRCSPLTDPPPLCCLPPDTIPRLGVSPPSTRVGQVRWQQPLGCGSARPRLLLRSGNRACGALGPLLAGRHLTGGTMPLAGASRAEPTHPRAVWTLAILPGPSVRRAPLLCLRHSSCPFISVWMPSQVS